MISQKAQRRSIGRNSSIRKREREREVIIGPAKGALCDISIIMVHKKSLIFLKQLPTGDDVDIYLIARGISLRISTSQCGMLLIKSARIAKDCLSGDQSRSAIKSIV